MEFLCAVIQEEGSGYQVLIEATLHNIPLSIIPLTRLYRNMPEQELNLIQSAGLSADCGLRAALRLQC